MRFSSLLHRPNIFDLSSFRLISGIPAAVPHAGEGGDGKTASRRVDRNPIQARLAEFQTSKG